MEMTASSNKCWRTDMLEKLLVSFHKGNNKEEICGEFTVIC